MIQGGESRLPSDAHEALEQILERTKGDPRRREEEIKALQDRRRGKAVMNAAPALALPVPIAPATPTGSQESSNQEPTKVAA